MENDHLADAILWLEAVLDGMRAGSSVDPEDIKRAISEIKMAQNALTALDRVKSLAWEETFIGRGDGGHDVAGWEADSGFGSHYLVEQYFGSDSYGWFVKFGSDAVGDFDDPDNAKQAAQADFERRIRAAFQPVIADHRKDEP